MEKNSNGTYYGQNKNSSNYFKPYSGIVRDNNIVEELNTTGTAMLTANPQRMEGGTERLFAMLSYGRPYASSIMPAFRRWLLAQLPETAWLDAEDNIICKVGENPHGVMFSSHYDTVHQKPGKQRVCYDMTRDELFVENSSCLGADNTSGMWLMLELIDAGVEGLYVFHDGEEVGCIGSEHIASKTPGVVEGIRMCIAFDRKGENDIITHQMGSRTASDEFADSLALQLGMAHIADPTGAFTDTNEYADLIPECTNISVGFARQHTANETQNMSYLRELRDALVKVDWSAVCVERDPEIIDDEDLWAFGLGGTKPFDYNQKQPSSQSVHDSRAFWSEVDEMTELVADSPEAAALLLVEAGFRRVDMYDAEAYVRCEDTDRMLGQYDDPGELSEDDDSYIDDEIRRIRGEEDKLDGVTYSDYYGHSQTS